MELEGVGVGFGNLPEGCISHVLSLTSPKDTCRSAAVGPAFRSAAESDAVWEGFLPADYRDVLARADETVEFRSKKELYFRLCRPLVIDKGRKSFVLEKSTGKKCYMLSARDLVIIWGDTPNYWSWGSLPQSRFSEVAKLVNVCWLEIRGRISASMLSPGTTYTAYLVYKLSPQSYGLDCPSQKASVTVGHHTSEQTVQLQPKERASSAIRLLPRRRRGALGWLPRNGQFLDDRLQESPEAAAAARVEEAAEKAEQVRSDRWTEAALGEFVVDQGCTGDVEISLLETEGGQWKRGLIVEGIEVRPNK